MEKEKHESLAEDMYREHILELYKSPSNFGKLPAPSHQKTAYNTVCGDEITVQMIVKKDVVKEIKFSGSGCVISVVAASLLTDKIRGIKTSDIKSMKAEDFLKLLKMKLNPARIKCALLAFEAVLGALK